MVPSLPIELVNRILEYLWDDMRALFYSSLACHRYREAPACRRVRVTRPSHTMYIQNRADIDAICCALSSQSTRGFYLQDGIRFLLIGSNVQTSLVNIMPFRISPSHLPALESIEIYDVDWMTYRPHPNFFLRLAHFTSVTRLELRECRFCYAHELRRLTNAFPALTTLHLDRTTCGRLTSSGHPSLRRQTLEELYIPSMGLDERGRSMLAVCTSYSTITRLHMYVECFQSFSEFQSFVCHFAQLVMLSISSFPGPPRVHASGDAPELSQVDGRLPPFILNRVGVYRVPWSFAGFLFLWLAKGSVSTLEQFIVHPPEDPGAAAGCATSNFLNKTVNTLGTVHMTVFVPGMREIVKADPVHQF